MLRNNLFAGRLGCSLVLLCIASIVTAPGTWAGEADGLAGTYAFVPERSGDVSRAIEQAVGKMGFVKRPIARGRLSKTNVPYQRVRIDITASEVAIGYDGREPIRMPRNGQAIQWKREDGESFDVSARFDGDKLLQTYQAEDGKRVNAFYKAADGTLHLDVEVSSPQLPQPLKYELVYRPAA